MSHESGPRAQALTVTTGSLRAQYRPTVTGLRVRLSLSHTVMLGVRASESMQFEV